MRKVLAVFMILITALVLTTGCTTAVKPDNNTGSDKDIEDDVLTAAEPDYSLYKPYIQSVLDNLPQNEYANGYGVLYDVDSNGVDELIMVYDSDDVKHPNSEMTGMAVAYSVYTIDNENVVELIAEHFLFPMAGGPSGEVYVLEKPQEKLLGFKYTELNPGSGEEMHCLGDWYIYSVNEKSADTKYEVDYMYAYTLDGDNENINYSNSRANTADSVDQTYDWFHKWISEYEQTEILAYSDKYSDNELSKLIDTL